MFETICYYANGGINGTRYLSVLYSPRGTVLYVGGTPAGAAALTDWCGYTGGWSPTADAGVFCADSPEDAAAVMNEYGWAVL